MEVHYSAFLSYSHQDDRWAKWLLKTLETYRVPPALVGTPGPEGPIPARLGRIFRDREELAAGAHLGAKIRAALEQSQTLLVVCSQNAVHSYGVNEEIKLFRKIHGDDRIFYIIMDGEPGAEARGLNPALECFPAALRKRGTETSTRYGVPLAADARAQGDGRKMAILKVVAGILGVNLDSLVRRDLQRRQRKLLGITLAATAGILITSLAAAKAFLETKRAEDALAAAEYEQEETEKLVEYIVDDLTQKLWRRGGSDLIFQVQDRLLEHYEGENSPQIGPKEVARRVKALSYLVGYQIQLAQDDRIARLLNETVAMSTQVAEENFTNIEMLDAHAQLLEFATSFSWLRGDFQTTDHILKERLKVGQQIQALGAKKLHPRSRLSNAMVSQGHLLLEYYTQPAEAKAAFEKGLALRGEIYAEALRENDPMLHAWHSNYAGGYFHLAFAEEIFSSLDTAIQVRQRAIAEYASILQRKPNELLLRYLHTRLHNDLAETMTTAGYIDEAKAAIATARSGFTAILKDRENHLRWAVMAIRPDHLNAQILYSQGRFQEAIDLLAPTCAGIEVLQEQVFQAVDIFSWLLETKTLFAASLLGQGNQEAAEKWLMAVSGDIDSKSPDFFKTVTGRKMRALFNNTLADLRMAQGRVDDAQMLRKEITLAFGEGMGRRHHPLVRFELMKAYMGLKQYEEAAEIAENLRSIGFRRVDFLQTSEQLAQAYPGWKPATPPNAT